MGKVTYPRVDGATFIGGAFERNGILYLPRVIALLVLGYPGWRFKELVYEKRTESERVALRREFDRSVKGAFLQFLAREHRQPLKQHGFTDDEILAAAQGSNPTDYQVHHIIPLDDLGTNAFSNLILIRAQEHAPLSAYQNKFTRSMSGGEVIVVDFPVPPEGQLVWPSVADEEAPAEELWIR